MNQPYARVNQPFATLTLASALREMFGVQLYKNNACALLSRILSILNLDWLQHARSVRGVYETLIILHCLFPHVVTVLWQGTDDVMTVFSSTSGTSGRLQNCVSVLLWFLHSDYRVSKNDLYQATGFFLSFSINTIAILCIILTSTYI